MASTGSFSGDVSAGRKQQGKALGVDPALVSILTLGTSDLLLGIGALVNRLKGRKAPRLFSFAVPGRPIPRAGSGAAKFITGLLARDFLSLSKANQAFIKPFRKAAIRERFRPLQELAESQGVIARRERRFSRRVERFTLQQARQTQNRVRRKPVANSQSAQNRELFQSRISRLRNA